MSELLKVGDKIRCTNDYSTTTTKGNVYEISKVVPITSGISAYYHYADDEGDIDNMDTIKHDNLPSFFEVIRNHTEHFATPFGNEVGAGTTQAERIEAVCNEVRDLLIRKNHDYGDSFSKQYAKYGVLSGLIRMDDKMARLDTLINGEQAQVAESVEDSLLDLIGYATLTLVERRKGAE